MAKRRTKTKKNLAGSIMREIKQANRNTDMQGCSGFDKGKNRRPR